MSEPVTTTTASFIMPSPTQLIVGGIALGVGLTAGYGLACWTASLVDSGLEKSGIKDRVEKLMSSKKKKHEEDEEVEIEDELEDEEVEDEDEDEEDEDEDEEVDDELEEDEEVEAVKQSAKKAREKATA